jgi:hypothetical protein
MLLRSTANSEFPTTLAPPLTGSSLKSKRPGGHTATGLKSSL